MNAEQTTLDPCSSASARGETALVFIGPILLALSLSVQAMVSLLYVFGPVKHFKLKQTPTLRAYGLIRPERDVMIYVASVAGALLAMLAAGWIWRRFLRRLDESHTTEAAGRIILHGNVLAGVLSILSLFGFFLIAWARFPFTAEQLMTYKPRATTAIAGAWPLLIPGVAACAALLIDLRWLVRARNQVAPPGRPRAALEWIIALAAIALVVLAIFIPPAQWAVRTGRFFQRDWLHHWNFFAMGPAQGYWHGQRLASQSYSQYGVGWPLLAALAGRFVPLTYAHLLGGAVLYACVYYIALFVFLRRWLGTSLYAAIGVILAIQWQMFSGIGDKEIKWIAPSSTMLRHPLDIWFFLALLAAARARSAGGQLRWIGLAGFLCGLAMFFQLDTAILLVGTAIAFGIGQAVFDPPPDAATKRARKQGGLAFTILLLVGWLPGMIVAARGHIFDGAFWRGWIEGLRVQGTTGFGMLPFSSVDDSATLLFCAIILVNLFTIAWSVLACFIARWRPVETGERRPPVLLFPAFIALYGLGLQLNFVGRSVSNNIYHAMVPFALLCAYWLWRVRRALFHRVPFTSIPALLAIALVALLWTSAEMRVYPNLAKGRAVTATAGLRPIDLAHDDLLISPDADDRFQGILRDLQPKLRELSGHGPVLILDEHDTLLYTAAGIAPWERYPSLLYMCESAETVKRIRREITDRKPMYVVIRGPDSREKSDAKDVELIDVVQWMYKTVLEHCTQIDHVGPYEIWQWK